MNKQLVNIFVEKLQWVDSIVVFVWILLSALMIATAWLLVQQKGEVSKEVKLVILLMIATWSYPLYTLFYKLVPGLIGNILYLALAIYVILQVRNVSVHIAYLLYPIVMWVGFATIYVIFQLLAK
jgi:tryptophan-rich sensory protein